MIAQFTDQVHAIVTDELRSNSQLVADYLKHPHSQSPRQQPRLPAHQPLVNFTVKSNLQKAKQHLHELTVRNQKAKEQAEKLAGKNLSDSQGGDGTQEALKPYVP